MPRRSPRGLQATGLIAIARSPGQLFQGCAEQLVPNDSPFVLGVMVLTMTAGTAVIMWLAELITDRGIGNGMSLLIFTSIIARFPQQLWAIQKTNGGLTFAAVMAMGVALVVRWSSSSRPTPDPGAVRQADDRPPAVRRHLDLHPHQGQPGRRHPRHLRVVAALHPDAARQPVRRPDVGLGGVDPEYFVRGDHPLYVLTFYLLIIFFTYFYVSITFNPDEVAENMKKYGGFIPGIRAGRPTAEYLDYVLSRLTAAGLELPGFIAVLPLLAFAFINLTGSFPFGGTSILIMVGVGLDTVKQIESQLQQRNYEGFLR